VGFGALPAPLAQDQPQLNLPRVKLQAGMHQMDVQVAYTPEQRQIGLMFRKEMPQHEGMLFVFEQPTQQCFWMKNTLLPLTAAFVADDGTIVNLADMKPQTTDSHCSAKPVRFVLEMNQGWFAKKAIRAGFQADRQAVRPPANKSLSLPARAQHEKGRASAGLFDCMQTAGSLRRSLASAKLQFTSLSRKVSTNFGRRLR
jgi:uncharacterized membrane protein (UPF0127 family)